MKTKQNTNSSLMKNIFLLLLLFTGMVEAQIVTIPDANFKAALIAPNYAENTLGIPLLSVDTNSDGDIDVSEAMNVAKLSFQSGTIIDITGIEAFVNMKEFACPNNQITSLVLTSLSNLQVLNCSGNQITYIDVSGLSLLSTFDYTSNLPLGHLDLSGTSVTNVFNSANLAYLDVSNCTSITHIGVSSSSLTYIDFTGCTALYDVYLENSMLISLDIHDLPSLQELLISNNLELEEINVTNCPILWNFYCSQNALLSLNVLTLTSLTALTCANNFLTTLDVSNQPNLATLICDENNIQNLFMKNGSVESYISFGSGNPNLQFICTDDSQVGAIQIMLNNQGRFNVVCTSYCSFNPGGNYNTITGNMKLDFDNNGCDPVDITPNNIRIDIASVTTQGASFLNNTGSYRFYTLTGNYTLTPSFENPSYFNFSPITSTIVFADNNNNVTTQDFCITANGAHSDVEVVIAPIIPARPGFEAKYIVVYKNKGNQALSGNINLTFYDDVLDFVTATIPPVSQNTGLLNWNYSNLKPFEARSFYITFHVNTPTNTPPVNIADQLRFHATITPIIDDENSEDNLFTFNQTVVGSFDPNDITCLEGDVVPATEIGNYLHYAINFENTGTFPAENVVVKTEVDLAKFDIGSLQLMNTNFPVDARITGNKVEFIFENIQLPIGGHGHILLKLKTQNTLVTGDAVANRGDIFFDYNFPIDTGLANTVFQTLSNSVFEMDSSVAVYPNPSNNIVTIKADNKIKSIELYDVQGRIVLIKLMDESESRVDISSYANGIYFLKVATDRGAAIEKIVKE